MASASTSTSMKAQVTAKGVTAADIKVWSCGKPLDVEDTVEAAGCLFTAQPISGWWLVFRFVSMAVVLFVLFLGLALYDEWGWLPWYMIYFTHWLLLTNLIYTILSFTLTALIYRRYAANGNKAQSIDEMGLRWLWTATTIFLQGGTATIFMLPIVFWGVIYNNNCMDTGANYCFLSVLEHGGTLVPLAVDFFCSCWQASYFPGTLYAMGMPLVWNVFAVIYVAAGGDDQFGDNYIYSAIDWVAKPAAAAPLVAVLLALAAAAHALLVFLKNMVIKCWLKDDHSRMKNMAEVEV